MTKLYINPNNRKSKIKKEIYGHFSEHLGRCIYEGIYVGDNADIPNKNGIRTDIAEAFRHIKMPVLRWPGGCFADEYHWKDGIGDKNSRKKMVNTNWGGVVEDNSFGTHEFMELCEQIGCEPYIAGNLGSGTVQELAEWVEYMTFDGVSPMADLRRKNGREKPWKLKYLGIGNENWGCGGNMRPEYYADEYRRYQSFCKNYSGNNLFKVACGPNSDDYNWTEKLLDSIKPWHTNAISLHYYTVPTGNWDDKGDAVDFTPDEYYKTLEKTLYIEELINKHTAIMDRYDEKKEIGLIVDEWGTWYNVQKGTNPGFLFQQNTMRDAVLAAINLNIFNAHSDRVIMANIAQAVNVLQALILTEGAKMVKTPTYHVFDLFKCHQDAVLVESRLDSENVDGFNLPVVSQSVSISEDETITITLSNCSLQESVEIETEITDFSLNTISASILTGAMNAHNTFDTPNEVSIQPFANIKQTDKGVFLTLPPVSVVSILLK